MSNLKREIAGGVIVGGFAGQRLPPELQCALKERCLAGVIWFKRNIDTLEQVSAVNAQIRALAPQTPPLIAIDQEGGRVARLGSPVVHLAPMRQFGAINNPRLTERAAHLLSTQLRMLGFTMNLAPVLDVTSNPQNQVIGDRAFGDDPELVTQHANAWIEGAVGAGMLTCAKHFPGHGDTTLDSHLSLPVIDHDRSRLDRIELVPFRALAAKVHAIMSAHIRITHIDDAWPATLSEKILSGILRNELGFSGVILSDDLEMKAITEHWSIAEAACRAIAAGCDGVLICSDLNAQEEARRALAAQAEHDSIFRARLEQAHTRMQQLRLRSAPPLPFDGEAMAEQSREFEAQFNPLI